MCIRDRSTWGQYKIYLNMIKKILFTCLLMNLAFCSLRQLLISESDKTLYKKCIQDNEESPTAVLAIVTKLQGQDKVLNGCVNITQLSKASGEFITKDKGCEQVREKAIVRQKLLGSEAAIDGDNFECRILYKVFSAEDQAVFKECSDDNSDEDDVTLNIIARVEDNTELLSACIDLDEAKKTTGINQPNEALCAAIINDKNHRKKILDSDAKIEGWKCEVVIGSDDKYNEACLRRPLVEGSKNERCAVSTREKKTYAPLFRVCENYSNLAYEIKQKLNKDVPWNQYCDTLKENYKQIAGVSVVPEVIKCRCSEKPLSAIIIQSVLAIFMALYILF
eukprot:TRINITY_DN455_c0_g1_i1.p1 TRINITY_DN455_c0_g1~~TRINITY_DN455_c0_g1_i1.p1  ORF type:complete len:336 (-),score=66.76 TRINITY_DN455_c0_g1_i1:130-1137(-)